MIRGALLAALLLPGIGAQETRVRVDATRPPWSALVRVQIPGETRCTGFAVAPRTVLTAAHCLWSRRLRRLMPAEAVHVLSGYQAGQFTRHVTAAAWRVGTGYSMPGAPGAMLHDVAVLTLPAPVTDAVLALGEAQTGQPAMLGGYSQDFSEIILADRGCHVTGLLARGAMVQHDCEGTRGTSGAPLLVADASGGWAVAGLQVGAAMGLSGGVAVATATLRGALGSE